MVCEKSLSTEKFMQCREYYVCYLLDGTESTIISPYVTDLITTYPQSTNLSFYYKTNDT